MAFFYVEYLSATVICYFLCVYLRYIQNLLDEDTTQLGRFMFLLLVEFLGSISVAAEIALAQLELIALNYEDVATQRRFEAQVEAVHKFTISVQLSECITEINFDVDDYIEQGTVLIRFKGIQQRGLLDQKPMRV
jgi:multidrug efflux pump subunit AcrA (membrane-fusion protein)